MSFLVKTVPSKPINPCPERYLVGESAPAKLSKAKNIASLRQCAHCQRYGHTEPWCWNKHSDLKGCCGKCGRPDHVESQCWILHPELKRSKGRPVIRTNGQYHLVDRNLTQKEQVKISNIEEVSSYNWIIGEEPTIVCPGK